MANAEVLTSQQTQQFQTLLKVKYNNTHVCVMNITASACSTEAWKMVTQSCQSLL